MLANIRVNKENYEEKVLKTDPNYDEAKYFRGREFGTEITNNTEASSDNAVDEKISPSVEQDEYEQNVPRMTNKTKKMSDHFAGMSISNRCVSIFSSMFFLPLYL